MKIGNVSSLLYLEFNADTPPNSVRISPPSHLHPPTHLHLHATAGVSQCILAHFNTDIYLICFSMHSLI